MNFKSSTINGKKISSKVVENQRQSYKNYGVPNSEKKIKRNKRQKEGQGGVSSVPFPFRFPFQLHCELVSSLLALNATEMVSQPLIQMAVEMINIHVISVKQKR